MFVVTNTRLSFLHLLLIFKIISQINAESCARDATEECSFGQRFVLESNNNTAISWKQAELNCLSKYGTHLASVHTHDDFEISKDICLTQGGGGRAKCWIGLYNPNGLDDAHFGWSDGTRYSNETHYWWWAAREPSSYHQGHSGEDCGYIAADKGGFWNDFNCSGIGDTKNNILVTTYLCKNPAFDPEKACACECDQCFVWGDPHFITFDKFSHHYQGECVYKYVSQCNGDSSVDVPFEIVGSHQECLHSGMTCVNEVFVRLYNDDGSLEYNIKLSESHSISFVNNGRYNNGQKYVYNGGKSWFQSGVVDNQLELKVYTGRMNVSSSLADIRIRVKEVLDRTGFASIWMTRCWREKLCGLCGHYDGNAANDMQLSNGSTLAPLPNVQKTYLMGRNEWEQTNTFGDSWLDTRYSTGSRQCLKDLDVVVKAATNECDKEATKVLCSNAYAAFCASSCVSHPNPRFFVEWLDGCIFDACSTCNSTIQINIVNETEILQCAASSIAICQIVCNQTLSLTYGPTTSSPSATPTLQPTQIPTDLPTTTPTTLPTSAPTPTPTELPSSSPSKTPTAYPTMTPTTTSNPSRRPSLTPSFEPTRFPTWAPTHSPTLSPTPSPTSFPTSAPTELPTSAPTSFPTTSPTPSPTEMPTVSPSTSPTKGPTPHPTYAHGILDFKLDIAVVTDDSCGLVAKDCESQHRFVSDVIEMVHDFEHARIAYLKYDDSKAEVVINFNSTLNNNKQNNAKHLFSLIRDDNDCGSNTANNATANSYAGFKKALEILSQSRQNSTLPTSHKQVVLSVNNCPPQDIDKVCALENELSQDNIKFISVNLGPKIECSSYSCLNDDETVLEKRSFCVPNLTDSSDLTKKVPIVAAEISLKLTESPTASPTFLPTKYPTKKPSETPTVQPTNFPTTTPTGAPSLSPTLSPTGMPTNTPTELPTIGPTPAPTELPTNTPTSLPTSTPSSSPTMYPTMHPTFDNCGLSFKVDLVVVMDQSCRLTHEECTTQNNFASDLVQKVHDGFNSRIALITYDESRSRTEFGFTSFFNLKQYSSALYASIRTLRCNENSVSVSTRKLDEALQKSISLYRETNMTDRARTMVLISNCQDVVSTSNVCNLKSKMIEENIDTIVVNVGNKIQCSTYGCLTDMASKIHCVPEWSKKEFDADIDKISKEICTAPTKSPTVNPTRMPTRSPTFYPTAKPTQKIWWKKPWYPVQPQWWHAHSHSHSSSSSSSSSSHKHYHVKTKGWWMK